MRRWGSSQRRGDRLCAPSTPDAESSVTVDNVTADSDTVRVLDAEGAFAPSPAAERVPPPHRGAARQRPRAVLPRHGHHPRRSMRRRPTCNGRDSSRCGRRAAARRPPRSDPPARPARRTTIFPSYREHAVTRIRGVDPVDIIKLMRGTSNSGWDPSDPKNGNTRIYTLVLGSQTLHATGLAMGLVFDGKCGTGDVERDEAVMVYYGDGASSQGDVHEAMVFAASYPDPRGVLPAEQPLGDLRAGGDPVPRAARAARRRLRHPNRSASTATTCSRATPSRAGRWTRPVAGRGPARSRRSPTGWARTPRATTRPSTARATRSRTWARRDPIARMRAFLEDRGAAGSFFADVEAEAADAAEDLRVRTLELAAPGPRPSSTTCTASRTRSWPSRRRGTRSTRRRSRRAHRRSDRGGTA